MVRRNTIGNTAEEINLDFLHEQLLLAMKKIKISDGSIDKDTVLREITAYYERKFSSLCKSCHARIHAERGDRWHNTTKDSDENSHASE